MKTLSNKLIAAISLISLLALPLSAQAVASSPKPVTGFCASYSVSEAKLNTDISTNTAKLNQGRTDRASKLTQQREDADAKVTADRTKWDGSRADQFAQLEAKATTVTQKQAVTAFETAVKAAVAIRRSAVDQARTIFRQAEDAAIASRQSQVDGYLSTFKAAVASADAQIQASCNAGTSSPQVRSTFVAAVKAARSSYHTSVVGVTNLNGPVTVLAATRRAAVDSADAAFKTTIQQAGTTLKAVLHQ
jgi:hypothetical protein